MLPSQLYYHAFSSHLRSLRDAGKRVSLLSLDPGVIRSGFAVCADVFGSHGPGKGVVGAGFVVCPPRSFSTPGSRYDLISHVVGRLALRHGVCGVIVGWPLNPYGGRGGAECIFAEGLAQSLKDDLVPLQGRVLRWDERGSSVAARSALREARALERGTRLGGGARLASTNVVSLSSGGRGGLPREVAGRAVDEAAARVILSSFLGSLEEI